MKKKLFTLSLVFILGCTSKVQKQFEGELIPLEGVFKNKPKPININQVRYVYLENRNDILMGPISKTIFKNQRFYLFDASLSKTVFVFSLTGNFLYKLSQLGKGLGKYNDPLDFDVDEDNSIYIYDNDGMKIIKYSDGGQKFEEFKTHERFLGFTLLNKELIAVSKLFHAGILANSLSLYAYKEASYKEKFLPNRGVLDDLSLLQFSFHQLYKSDEKVMYYHRFSPYIYSISESGIKAEYKISGGDFPKEAFLAQTISDPSKLRQDSTNVKDVIDIYQNESMATMRIVRSGFPAQLLYDKTTKKTTVGSHLMTEIGELPGINGVAGNEFFSLIEAKFMFHKKQLIKNTKSIKPSDKTKLLETNVSDNPIIIMFDIKTP